MTTDKCQGCAERRQLDFIQRLGRIGYWEYDPEEQWMSLPEVSMDLLASITGSSPHTRQPFMDALPAVERKRFQTALDQAVARGLTLDIELELAGNEGEHAYIVVRGAALEMDHGAHRYAGIFQDITNEKHRETDHEKVIVQLQALLDALPQGVSVIDQDLRLIFWNRQFHEILDFPPEMVFKHARFDDFISLNAARGDYGPGNPEAQVQAIVARAREFLPHRFERQISSGRTVLVEGFPFKSAGEVSGFVTTYTDITEQKRNEEELMRQRDVLKTVIDNFPGAISLCDTDLRFTTYNNQFLELLDFPPSLFAKGWAHFEDLARFNAKRGEYGPGDAEEQVQTSVVRARNFQAHHIERARPNGRWLEIRGTPIVSGGFVTSYIDITERKKVDEALRKSEERWNFALEGANDGVWDWNFQAGEVLYSKRWKEMFGYAESDIGNTTAEWLERVHPDDLADVGTTIELHLYTQTAPPSIEYRFRCKDGSWKWTLGRGMVVNRSADGKPLRLVGTNSDISERKLIEAELVHSKEAAEASREQVASLLDNSGQGFLSFGVSLMVEAEYSRACETMLGLSPAGLDVAQVLFVDDLAKADLLRAIFPSVLAESDPYVRETMLSLLPTEIQRGQAILKAEYKILENDRFMLVLTDITDERRMAAMLDSERLRLELIVMAVSDSRNFFETIDGFRAFLGQGLPLLLHGAAAPPSLAIDLYREIHTYKGLLSQFSFPNTPKVLHAIETQISGLLAPGVALKMEPLLGLVSPEALQISFDADLAILSDALGADFLARGDHLMLSDAQARQLEKLATRLLRGETVDTSIAEVRTLLLDMGALRKVSFRDALLGFDGLVRQAARRMEKEVAPIEVNGGSDIWIDPEVFRPFLRSLVHVFRNAVAHGIETPELRWEAEKDEAGKITCTLGVEANTIKLSVADDGGGINLDALRQRAVATGIYSPSEVLTLSDDAMVQLIFMDNFSTQHEVTALAGRGVGLAAVLKETKNMGGELEVKSVFGRGTEFLFTLPLPQVAQNSEVLL